MKTLIKHKKVLIVFFLNLFIIFSFVACFFYDCHLAGAWLVFFCLFSISFLNLIIFYLLKILKRERENVCSCEKDSSLKIDACLDKMSKTYNVMEINRISVGIYHDLGNILTALNLSVDQIKCLGDNKRDAKVLTREILDISQKASSFVSFLKKQCCKKDEISNFNLSDEVRNCLALFNFYFTKYNIAIKTALQDDIFLFADNVKFDQVIINIISNAVESLKSKKDDCSRRIFVKIFKEASFIKIVIKDWGVGIDKDSLGKVFNPFFSSKKDKKDDHCGLGLFLVKNIIENDFFGKIKIKSDINRGAKFIIKIPEQLNELVF